MKTIITTRKNGTKRIQYKCETTSQTDQQWVEDADVNNIMANYNKTRNWPGVPRGQYMDLTGITDLQGAIETVAQASKDFMQVPSHIREKFDNDPAKFHEYLSKEENWENAEKAGLLQLSPKLKVSGETKSKDAVVPVPEPAAPAAPAKPDQKA